MREEIEEIIVDCYDDEEVFSAWGVAFEDGVTVPFSASLVGVPVEVTGFRVSEANVVQCQVHREDKQRWVSVEDLDETGLPADLEHLLTLYHAWQQGDY